MLDQFLEYQSLHILATRVKKKGQRHWPKGRNMEGSKPLKIRTTKKAFQNMLSSRG
jgi:hypothetical protein